MAWGVAIVAFGLAPWLWLALACLALAGAADEVSGPTLGSAEAGVAASVLGLRASVVVGGVLCWAGSAALAAVLPAFWRYDARTWTATVPPPSPTRASAAPL